MHNNQSSAQVLATRTNFRKGQERVQLRVLAEEKYGACRKCEYDDLDNIRCSSCINGGGKEILFVQRKKCSSAEKVNHSHINAGACSVRSKSNRLTRRHREIPGNSKS